MTSATMIDLFNRFNIPEDSNVYFLPFHKKHHYHSYSSLFHLIPHKSLKYNGLPCFKRGLWPVGWFTDPLYDLLPRDFDDRLAKAFSFHIWPLINSGSKASSFSKDDPLKILSHNLDFWLPWIFKVVENRLNQFERVEIENEDQLKKMEEARLYLPPGVEPVRPLTGGAVWQGEADAWEATTEMVEFADSRGKLRGIIDAIMSNRVEEDFSGIWSNAREDFERKLYKKRSKIKITFVELTETLPVHGPDAEFHENLLWEDFFGILDQKEKRIVVCLRNGTTRLGDIANEMGYANHSPISKALKKIREKATKFLKD
ncbi:MAG: sigma-70 family RNA polymerase sigma factor [Desulfomonilaceae bacterium]